MGALILPEYNGAACICRQTPLPSECHWSSPSAYDGWLAQRGAKTLYLHTVKQHGINALAVAHALESAEGVEEVIYPGLPGETEASKRKYELARKALSSHCP
jgi:cystathionine gamma-lyase